MIGFADPLPCNAQIKRLAANTQFFHGILYPPTLCLQTLRGSNKATLPAHNSARAFSYRRHQAGQWEASWVGLEVSCEMEVKRDVRCVPNLRCAIFHPLLILAWYKIKYSFYVMQNIDPEQFSCHILRL
jgi:hypothetical protein